MGEDGRGWRRLGKIEKRKRDTLEQEDTRLLYLLKVAQRSGLFGTSPQIHQETQIVMDAVGK